MSIQRYAVDPQSARKMVGSVEPTPWDRIMVDIDDHLAEVERVREEVTDEDRQNIHRIKQVGAEAERQRIVEAVNALLPSDDLLWKAEVLAAIKGDSLIDKVARTGHTESWDEVPPLFVGDGTLPSNERYADEVERVRNDAHRAIVAILEAVGGTVIVSRNVLESIDYNTVVSMYERPLSRDVVWTTKDGGA